MRYRFLRFPEGREKALTTSYDDGCKYDEQLIEIANRYGIKVTLNINSGLMGGDDWHLPWEKLEALAASGKHEIAVHGEQHIAPGKTTVLEGIRDVLNCRRMLEEKSGKIIRGMAFPDSGIRSLTAGVTREQIKGYLTELGIAYARTLGGDNDSFALPEDFLEWMPTAHHNNPLLFEYLDRFLSHTMPVGIGQHAPLLFYLWGHSYEFDNLKNWDRFEAFCQKAGGREDVWYATNMELCAYVCAYRQLQISVNSDLVYNPTCTHLWFHVDGKDYSVKPGETVRVQ